MQMVRLFDSKTNTVSEIPACELTGDVLRVSTNGVEGEVYMYARDLNEGRPKRSHQAMRKWMPRINFIRMILADVYPQTKKEWVEGFRKDLDIEGETKFWMILAGHFWRINQAHHYSKPEQQEVFNILFRLGMSGTADEILAQCNYPLLGRQRAEEVLQMASKPPKPYENPDAAGEPPPLD